MQSQEIVSPLAWPVDWKTSLFITCLAKPCHSFFPTKIFFPILRQIFNYFHPTGISSGIISNPETRARDSLCRTTKPKYCILCKICSRDAILLKRKERGEGVVAFIKEIFLAFDQVKCIYFFHPKPSNFDIFADKTA